MATRLIFSRVNNEFKKVFKKMRKGWPGYPGILHFACGYCTPDHIGDFALFRGHKGAGRGIYQRSGNSDEFVAVGLK